MESRALQHSSDFYTKKAEDIFQLFLTPAANSKEVDIAGLAKFLQEEVATPPQHDISRQQHAEAALLASNERFAYMMAATFDVIWDWDLTTNTIYYGDAYKNMFGYEPGIYHFSLEDEVLEKIIYSEDVAAVKNSLQQALQSNKNHWRAEYRRLKHRGGYAVVTSKAIIIRNEHGAPTRMVGAMQDITSKRNLITALNNSVEKIWSLLHNISDIITLVDKYGVIQYQSTSDKHVLGYEEFEVVGRNIYSLLHPDDNGLINIDAQQQPGQTFNQEVIECRLQHKNGHYVFVEMQLNNQLNNTAIRGVILTSHDITHRKKRDEEKNELLHKLKLENEEKRSYAEALEESEQRYKYLFEESPAPLIIWDHDTLSILDCNEAVLEKYGYTRQEFTSLKVNDISLYNDFVLAEAFKNSSPPYGGIHKKTWQQKKKNGETMYVQITGFLFDYKGTKAVFNHINDITEILDATSKLQQSEERYKLLFYKSPVPKVIYNTTTLQIVDANESFVFGYGYTLDELKTLTLDTLLLQKELKRFKATQQHNKGKAHGMVNWGMFLFRQKNRQKLIADIFANELVYNGAACMLLSCVNATERVASQEKIKKTSERLRQLATYLNDIREDDRANIAREIHDELGQQLTGVKMDVYWLKEELPGLPEENKLQFESILKLIDRTIGTVRKISTALRPIMLDDLGLLETLKLHSREYEKRFGIKVDFTTNLQEIVVPPKTAINIFRIFQETLTNVARHAGAKQVACQIKGKEDKITLKMKDDGNGFDVTKIAEKKTLGLLGMRERVIMLEGDFTIHSHPGAGTEVIVTIPLAPVAGVL